MRVREDFQSECDNLRSNGFTESNKAEFDMRQEAIAEIDETLSRFDQLDALVRQDRATDTRNHIRFDEGQGAAPPSAVSFGESYSSDQVRLMAESLSARCGGPAPSNEAKAFTHMRVIDMAKECLALRGVRTTFLMSPNAIVQRALHTSSDFVELLTGAGNRILRTGYESYKGGLVRICKQSTARDFRAKQTLMLGEAPELLEVPQHGEVKRGTMAESKESYSLATFARIFGITRQALVNDDLDAFGDMTQRLGRAAAEFVAAQLTAKLVANPTMNDSVALFHANHGNVGTAGAISITTLTEALKKLRLQKGLDGTTVIDVTPKYLVVPAALEVVARQYVAQINATSASNVNPFSAQLDVVVDPRLDASSATAWYLAADPLMIDTLEYSFLEGEEGPQIESRAGFDVEGIEMKVRLDFGCGVLDYRGLFKNAGA
ncbi:MAG TPA: Mu-like prophage major head subunit gpT family protein [Vicinamibacterales bacterium]|nr:Mu-like prophage major head subunit gpT family protein [Vicinamibacterales bacterium]